MEIKDIFSSRLRKLRAAKGKEYTRQRVADDLNISRASLEYYEKGQRLPDIEVAAKIADYYNVSADYLMGLTDKVSLNPLAVSISEQTPLNDVVVDMLLNCIEHIRLNENETNTLNSFILALMCKLKGLSPHIENYAKMYNFTVSWIKAFAHEVLDDESDIERIKAGITATAHYVVNNSRFFLDFPSGFDVFKKIENDCIKHFSKEHIPHYWEFKRKAAHCCGYSVVNTETIIPDKFELEMHRAFKNANEMVNYAALTNVFCYYSESSDNYFDKIYSGMLKKAGG